MRVSSRGDVGEVESFGITARLRGLCGESPAGPKGLLGGWNRVAMIAVHMRLDVSSRGRSHVLRGSPRKTRAEHLERQEAVMQCS